MVSKLTVNAPFDSALVDVLVAVVERIEEIESRRGPIARSARSALSPEAQPYQDFIDRVLFALAGLSPQESAALEVRLKTML